MAGFYGTSFEIVVLIEHKYINIGSSPGPQGQN